MALTLTIEITDDDRADPLRLYRKTTDLYQQHHGVLGEIGTVRAQAAAALYDSIKAHDPNQGYGTLADQLGLSRSQAKFLVIAGRAANEQATRKA